MEFKDLNLTQLDKNLTEPERDEWQAIYASYRGRSLIVITHIDREEGFAFASRKLALEQIRRANVRRRYKEGQAVDVGVISVGRGVCTVTFNGYDVMLPQREISYSAVPDLREVLHPGDVRKAVVKEFSRADNVLKLSIKETMPHPFDGIETRHPLGCTRISTIVGKYGGGESAYLCKKTAEAVFPLPPRIFFNI